MLSENITISACLIVKNEEKQLPGCLESLFGVVDEIIIVDTGSTDQSITIAHNFGARVFEHPWQNDFSKHRNQAIKYATGNWLLTIDADERLNRANGLNKEEFIDTLRKLPADCNALLLPMRDITPQGEIATEYMNVRLVRNTADFHYEGIVHENPIFKGQAVITDKITLNHHGYHLTPKEMEKKRKRNTDLLLARAKNNPDDIATYFYLANHYAFVLKSTSDNLHKALEYGLKCIQLLSPDPNRWPFAYLGIYRAIGEIYFLLGDYKEAGKWCLKGFATIPDDPDLHFLMCKVSIAESKYEQTVKYGQLYLKHLTKYRKKPELARGRLLSSVSRNSELATQYRIMVAYLGMKKSAKAENVWPIVKDFVLSTNQLKMEYLQNLFVASDYTHLLERTVIFYITSSSKDKSLLIPLLNFAITKGTFEKTYKDFSAKLPPHELSIEVMCYLADYIIKHGCSEQATTLLAPLYSNTLEKNYNLITLLATAYERIGKTEQAQKIYDSHLNDTNTGADFIINGMNFYKNIGNQNKLQTAVSALLKRFQYNELADDILLFLIEFYWILAKHDDFLAATIEIFSRHIEQLPQQFQDNSQIAEGYVKLSANFVEKEKYSLAIQTLHIAWSITGDPKYIYLIGNLFADTNQTIQALQYYQEALNRDFITPDILDRMHAAHLKTGNDRGAAICLNLKNKIQMI